MMLKKLQPPELVQGEPTVGQVIDELSKYPREKNLFFWDVTGGTNVGLKIDGIASSPSSPFTHLYLKVAQT